MCYCLKLGTVYNWLNGFYCERMANTALPCSSLAVTLAMHFVTKAPPINSIDSKCHIKKLKSSRTYLIDYSDFISRDGFQTHACQTPRQKQFQETRHTPAFGQKIYINLVSTPKYAD